MKPTFWIFPVPEIILLSVRRPEDVIPNEVDKKYDSCGGGTEVDWCKGEVACLEGVSERNPGKVTDGKHEPETIGGDVHGS